MERHRITVEDYEQFIGAEAVERILKKAGPLRDAHVVHVNSTCYGGGVAEILLSLTLLMNNMGVKKSLREGFGLTVAEAMWKGTPVVVGGNVGGIRYQIEDGVNGFLISSVEEAAARVVQLLKDEGLREQMGQKAKESVRGRFLLTRYLEQHLDLYNSFETVFKLKGS